MDLKFSHVDVLVNNLEEACAYYAQILQARISRTLVWERGGLYVRYAVALIGQERFMLVQPLAGNLKELLDSSGEGMIYRHCYSTPDIEKAYDELVVAVLVSFKHHFPAAALSSDGGERDWARGIALYERATGRQAPSFGVLAVPPEAYMAADLIEINRRGQG